jgi:hypothetical protein
MILKDIDIEKFISLSFVERIFYIYSIYQKRLWSCQLAEIWNLISRCIEDPAERSLIIRQMIQLAPQTKNSEAAFEALFTNSTHGGSKAVERVHVIVSCEKYRHKSDIIYEQLSSRLQNLFLIIGRPELKTARFDGKFLYVPTPDNYESLPIKVLEAFTAVMSRFGDVAIIKIDDDVTVEKSHSVDKLTELLANIDYAGELAGGPQFDRCWHIGKCENPGTPIHSKRVYGAWARGPLYYLSKQALRIVVHEYIFYPGEIIGQLDGLEDKLISDILRRHHIVLNRIDLEPLLGLKTTNESMPLLD